MTTENRSFTRSDVDVEALIKFGDCAFVTDRVSSISLNGMYLPCSEPPAVGARCRIVVYIGGRRSGTQIKATGSVTRIDEHGVGIAFEQVTGSDSLHHLRQLVLLNSPDPHTAEREFETHLGLRSRAGTDGPKG